MQETWVQSVGQEDPSEKEMAAHSAILASKIPWTEEPGGLQSMGSQRVNMPEHTYTCKTYEACLLIRATLCPSSNSVQLQTEFSYERRCEIRQFIFCQPEELPKIPPR